jgi:hypothetical protein
MKFGTLLVLVLWCVIPSRAAGESIPGTRNTQQGIGAGQSARDELVRKIHDIERQLREARAEHQALVEEERAALQDVTGPDTETGEVGARRAEISGNELPRLHHEKRILEQRIADGTGLLAKQVERRSWLLKRARDVAAQLQAAAAR